MYIEGGGVVWSREVWRSVVILLMASTASRAAPTMDTWTETTDVDFPEEGCYYQFNHYAEGEQIVTNEPCLNCTCHNQMLMCFLRVCPFIKPVGKNCVIEKKEDQCCPTISCPPVPVDIWTSTALPPAISQEALGITDLDSINLDNLPMSTAPGGCDIDGRFYMDGMKIATDPASPCDLCYCIRNHTACVMQECTLKVDGCEPVYVDGVCCPVKYICADGSGLPAIEGGQEDKGDDETTVGPVSTVGSCSSNGEFYANGADIITEDPCEHCYCLNGDVVCAIQECMGPLEGKTDNCTALPPPPGQCCPVEYRCEPSAVTEVPSVITTTDVITETNEPVDVEVGATTVFQEILDDDVDEYEDNVTTEKQEDLQPEETTASGILSEIMTTVGSTISSLIAGGTETPDIDSETTDITQEIPQDVDTTTAEVEDSEQFIGENKEDVEATTLVGDAIIGAEQEPAIVTEASVKPIETASAAEELTTTVDEALVQQSEETSTGPSDQQFDATTSQEEQTTQAADIVSGEEAIVTETSATEIDEVEAELAVTEGSTDITTENEAIGTSDVDDENILDSSTSSDTSFTTVPSESEEETTLLEDSNIQDDETEEEAGSGYDDHHLETTTKVTTGADSAVQTETIFTENTSETEDILGTTELSIESSSTDIVEEDNVGEEAALTQSVMEIESTTSSANADSETTEKEQKPEEETTYDDGIQFDDTYDYDEYDNVTTEVSTTPVTENQDKEGTDEVISVTEKEEAPVTDATALVTAVLDSDNNYCIGENGKVYQHMEDVEHEDSCKLCQCTNGEIVCAEQECILPEYFDESCVPLPVKDGQCCPDYECTLPDNTSAGTDSDTEETTVTIENVTDSFVESTDTEVLPSEETGEISTESLNTDEQATTESGTVDVISSNKEDLSTISPDTEEQTSLAPQDETDSSLELEVETSTDFVAPTADQTTIQQETQSTFSEGTTEQSLTEEQTSIISEETDESASAATETIPEVEQATSINSAETELASEETESATTGSIFESEQTTFAISEETELTTQEAELMTETAPKDEETTSATSDEIEFVTEETDPTTEIIDEEEQTSATSEEMELVTEETGSITDIISEEQQTTSAPSDEIEAVTEEALIVTDTAPEDEISTSDISEDVELVTEEAELSTETVFDGEQETTEADIMTDKPDPNLTGSETEELTTDDNATTEGTVLEGDEFSTTISGVEDEVTSETIDTTDSPLTTFIPSDGDDDLITTSEPKVDGITTLSPAENEVDVVSTNGSCIYQGQIYQDFDDIPSIDVCKLCYCSLGEVICAERECLRPVGFESCEPLPPKSGDCCPEQYSCATSSTAQPVTVTVGPIGPNEVTTQVISDKEDNIEIDQEELVAPPGTSSAVISPPAPVPIDSSSTSLPIISCSEENGTSVPLMDKCDTACYCINNIVECDKLQCHPAPPGLNCTEVYSDDKCCPNFQCIGEDLPDPESESHIISTIASSSIEQGGEMTDAPITLEIEQSPADMEEPQTELTESSTLLADTETDKQETTTNAILTASETDSSVIYDDDADYLTDVPESTTEMESTDAEQDDIEDGNDLTEETTQTIASTDPIMDVTEIEDAEIFPSETTTAITETKTESNPTLDVTTIDEILDDDVGDDYIDEETFAVCNINGTIYQNLTDVPHEDACKLCQCLNGEIICAERECLVPAGYENCVPLAPKKGECCSSSWECDDTEISTEFIQTTDSSPSTETVTEDDAETVISETATVSLMEDTTLSAGNEDTTFEAAEETTIALQSETTESVSVEEDVTELGTDTTIAQESTMQTDFNEVTDIDEETTEAQIMDQDTEILTTTVIGLEEVETTDKEDALAVTEASTTDDFESTESSSMEISTDKEEETDLATTTETDVSTASDEETGTETSFGESSTEVDTTLPSNDFEEIEETDETTTVSFSEEDTATSEEDVITSTQNTPDEFLEEISTDIPESSDTTLTTTFDEDEDPEETTTELEIDQTSVFESSTLFEEEMTTDEAETFVDISTVVPNTEAMVTDEEESTSSTIIPTEMEEATESLIVDSNEEETLDTTTESMEGQDTLDNDNEDIDSIPQSETTTESLIDEVFTELSSTDPTVLPGSDEQLTTLVAEPTTLSTVEEFDDQSTTLVTAEPAIMDTSTAEITDTEEPDLLFSTTTVTDEDEGITSEVTATEKPTSEAATLSNEVDEEIVVSTVAPGLDLQEGETLSEKEDSVLTTESVPSEGEVTSDTGITYPLTSETSSKKPMKEFCLFQGMIIPHLGDVPSKDACKLCQCVEGEIVCATQECPGPPTGKENCQPIPSEEGECCPSYECSEDEEPLDSTEVIDETDLVKTSTSSAEIYDDDTDNEYDDATTASSQVETTSKESEEITTVSEDAIITSPKPVTTTQLTTLITTTLASEGQITTTTPAGIFPNENGTYGTASGDILTEDDYPDFDLEALGPGACLFESKIYVSAQQIPRDNPCDFCFCFRGDIICLQQSCPPPIPGCKEEIIPGFCCPRYECPVKMSVHNITRHGSGHPTEQESALSSWFGWAKDQGVDPHSNDEVYQQEVKGCEVQGQFYEAGSIVDVSSGPCLQCRCDYDEKLDCEPLDCETQPLLKRMLNIR